VIKRTRYFLEYVLTLAGAKAVQAMPLAWAQALGRGLGRAAYAWGVARRTSLDNLKEHLGVEDAAERRRIASAAYANFGQTMVELARMPVMRPEALKAMFDFEGLEQLHAAKAAGKGIVCLSAHFGNWEWMGAALITHGFPVTFLIGTQSNPWVDRLFNEYRAKVGIQFVRIKSIKDALRVLKQGGLVALLGDQDGDKWGTFVPFFGQPASTHSIGELLARKSGAALAYGVPVRMGAQRHHLKIHLLSDPPAGLSDIQAGAYRLSEYNRLLEADIRRHPEHWLWMHHRWRSLPLHRLDGEERRRAERGELSFDTAAQAWRDSRGEISALQTWK
jgi:KDO2-lipid IV(A) lauroyltransferase